MFLINEFKFVDASVFKKIMFDILKQRFGENQQLLCISPTTKQCLVSTPVSQKKINNYRKQLSLITFHELQLFYSRHSEEKLLWTIVSSARCDTMCVCCATPDEEPYKPLAKTQSQQHLLKIIRLLRQHFSNRINWPWGW